MLNACIIGAGSIGALKPDQFDAPKSKNILTHAHALFHFKKIGMIDDFFIVDNNFFKRRSAGKKWKCKAFNNLYSLRRYAKYIDMFIVATSTEYHVDIMNEILEHFDPKLVIVEKPFCSNYKEAFEIQKKYNNRKIQIVVNYTRRFCISLQSLREELVAGKYGKIKACNAVYVRGFIRDASHALDLCNYFFGNFKTGKILGNKINSYDDYSKEDLTLPVWMEFENCKNVYFTPVDGRDYSIFEFDILTENARIQIIDHFRKTKIFYKDKEEVYGDFYSLNYNNAETVTNNLENAMYFLHLNTIQYLKSKEKEKANYNLFCSGLDGLKVQEIYRRLGLGAENEKYCNNCSQNGQHPLSRENITKFVGFRDSFGDFS